MLTRHLTSAVSLLLLVTPAAAQSIVFDMPPTATATPAVELLSPVAIAGAPVTVALRLSSMVQGSALPEIDRWMIRCVPRDPSWRVLQTSPGTETASHYASALQVKLSDESSRSRGVKADIAYASLARANAGVEAGQKQCETIQFDRAAPLHAVTAAGTIERGRGAFFQLRWMAGQVLEGEKQLAITFDVPPGMRTGLIDVTVTAHGRPASGGAVKPWSELPGFGAPPPASQPLGRSEFVIGVTREGDETAWLLARQLAAAEATLRQTAQTVTPKTSVHSLPTLIRHVAAKLDIESGLPRADWVDRLVAGHADPYVDEVIRRLPTEARIQALDYSDLRREFLGL